MKRIIQLVFIFLIPCLLPIGCGKKEVSKDVITLAFWSDTSNRNFAQRIVDHYNSSQSPSVYVKFLPIEGSGYYSKLLTITAGGSPPDIMLLMPDEMVDFAARGGLLDLTPLTLNDSEFIKIKEDSWPDLWQINTYKGNYYGMPIWTNTIGVFYNKTMFDKAGLPYPDEHWDWDVFLTAAKKLTRRSKQKDIIEEFGFGGTPLSLEGWYSYQYIRQNGGNLFNDDKTECLLDSKEAVEAVQWAIDLTARHHVAPTNKDLASGQFGTGAEGLFMGGRVAMIVGGRWLLLPFSQVKDFEWSVAPLFRGKERVTISSAVVLGVSSKTKYPEGCWRFLKFVMNDKNGQRLIINDRSDISILKSVAYSLEYLNRYSHLKENEIFLKQLEYSEPYPYVIGQKAWMDYARMWLEKALLGQMSTKEACVLISQQYKNMVEKGEIRP